MPASPRAEATASTASRNSERPESFENSVAPMPAMAVVPEKSAARADPPHACAPAVLASSRAAGHLDGARHVVAQVVGAADRDVTTPLRPSSPSGPLSVTEPVSVMVESGWLGAPRRMFTSASRLRGPDQSVT